MVDAIKYGAVEFLVKPFEQHRLLILSIKLPVYNDSAYHVNIKGSILFVGFLNNLQII